MRLIYADALMETIRTHDYPLRDYFNSTDRGMYTSGIKQAVDEQPTIDAVEVVRCKDCRWGHLCVFGQHLGLDGFCSKGERKEQNDGQKLD